MRSRALATRAALGFALALAAACDERFEFDVPAAAGMPAAAGAGGRAAGGQAGGSAGGALGGGAGSAACGELSACPSGLHCVDGECHACATDGDCATSGLARCDLTRHRCVACISSGDCAEGYRCDSLANRCLFACSERSDCPATAHGCNARRGVCYACDEDRECATSSLGTFCAVDGSGCVQCRNDADCEDALCDPLTGRCVECRDGLDCSSKLCEPVEHVCLLEN